MYLTCIHKCHKWMSSLACKDISAPPPNIEKVIYTPLYGNCGDYDSYTFIYLLGWGFQSLQ